MKQMFGWQKKHQHKWLGISWMTMMGILTLLFLGCGGGGGGGGGGQTIDNSPFYGTYKIEFSTLMCYVEDGTISFELEVGNDPERQDEDNYLYIPRTSNSTSSSQQNTGDGTTSTLTVTVAGNQVTMLRREVVDADHTLIAEDKVVLTFNETYTMAEVAGHLYEDFENFGDGDCIGKIWNGVAWRTTDATPEVTYAYLQTRSPAEAIRGWVEFDKGGSMIDGDEIAEISLLDSEDSQLAIDPYDKVYRDAVYKGTWNAETQQEVFSGPVFSNGISLACNEELAAGDYTYEIQLQDDSILSYTLNFPGMLLLPVVDVETMTAQWLADGSLQLDWQNPEGEDYNMVQVEIYDVPYYMGIPIEEMVFSARLPKESEQLVIPAGTLADMNLAKVPKLLRWRMRTLAYNEETPANQYARGYSDAIGIEFDPGVTDTASGTWELDGDTLTLTFTASTFDGECGPSVAPGETTVETFTVFPGPDYMYIENENTRLDWFRFEGDTNEAAFTGKWNGFFGEFNWAMGNTYVADFVEASPGSGSGTFTLKGLISVCVDEPEQIIVLK